MNNTDAISRGLAQSAAGETVDLGDFTQYLIPDAAVEAAKAAIFKTYGQYDSGRTERIVEAVLAAALPHLGAAPSVEHIAHTPAETTALTGADAHLIVQAAQAMSTPSATRECLHADDCPCFTITPRTVR